MVFSLVRKNWGKKFVISHQNILWYDQAATELDLTASVRGNCVSSGRLGFQESTEDLIETYSLQTSRAYLPGPYPLVQEIELELETLKPVHLHLIPAR